jgi:hypothetical protein
MDLDLAHIDSDKKNYYYYANQNTKIEVIFRTRDDGKMEKVTRTYHLAEYSTIAAQRVRERQSWAKFGQAANNPNNNSVTSFGDNVELEILINYNTGNNSTSSIQYPISQPLREINKIFYIDSNYDLTFEKNKSYTEFEFNEQPKNETNEQPKNETNEFKNINEIKPKKSLVKCRHCGDSSHWSIKCPLQQKKLEEPEPKKKEDFDKHYKNKNNEQRKEQSGLTGVKVSDIDESLTEEELKSYFYQFGNIINFYMIRNKKNNRFNGTVYVTYSTKEENDNALINIKKKALNYMIPTVEPAKQRDY